MTIRRILSGSRANRDRRDAAFERAQKKATDETLKRHPAATARELTDGREKMLDEESDEWCLFCSTRKATFRDYPYCGTQCSTDAENS